jgi:division protein CdvB (Snf7/Vps24/ESCRT-III family)
VMYAAIQGLVEELKDRDKTIGELKMKSAELDKLKAKLQAVEERLQSLPPR